MEMKTSIEDISPVKKKLVVEIGADIVDKSVNAAYQRLGKRAKIPGFRPGKVPRRIMERYFGAEVQQDVTRELVKETLPKAVEETDTFPLTMPVIENDIVKTGQNFKYTATMEVKPRFELKDYMGVEVEKETCSVTDKDVKNRLEEIRRNNGTLNTVEEDRAVKPEDYVVIEYEGFENSQPMEGIKSENFLLRIGSNDFHPDFEKALIGRKKGEPIEIKVAFEETHYHPKLAGKAVDFKVKITELKEMELPELNDEFAKKLGDDFKDLETLEKKLKEDIIKREETRIDRELKKNLLEKIAEGVDFELPESLVESEVRNATENIRQNLIRSGSSMEKAGLDETRLRKNLKPGAEKRVKEMLILGKIAGDNGLSIDEVELTDGFRNIANSMGQDLQAVRRFYETNQLTDSFRENLLEEKTLNYLVNGATVIVPKTDEKRSQKDKGNPD
jgi:trigger factor